MPPSKGRATPAADPISQAIAAAVRDELLKFLPQLVDELSKRQPADVTPEPPPQRVGKFLSLKKDVVPMTGLSRSTLLRMVDAGKFPKPVVLSPGRNGWRSEDVAAWLEARK